MNENPSKIPGITKVFGQDFIDQASPHEHDSKTVIKPLSSGIRLQVSTWVQKEYTDDGKWHKRRVYDVRLWDQRIDQSVDHIACGCSEDMQAIVEVIQGMRYDGA